jgi:L-alanine-DL-glutamate epimerase-like enolase superfamily enzyme
MLTGLRVCRHTHGELGTMAAAHHHVCLTLPNLVDGNQQTAATMADDVLTELLPIATSPDWGVPAGVGLGIQVDEAKVEKYHRLYPERGQFLPYQPSMFGREERD